MPKTRKHNVDVHIGQCLKQLRTSREMSQARLGEALGVAFQQVQKYEMGSNRMSVSTLVTVMELFDVSPDYFFERVAKVKELSQSETGLLDDMVSYAMTAEGRAVLRAFLAIGDKAVRRKLIALVETVGGGG